MTPIQQIVLSPAQENGATQLRARIPAVGIDADEVIGSPAWLHSTQGFLTGPASEDEIVPRTAQTATRPGNDDPHRSIKRFLNDNAALFGHGSDVLTNNATVKDEFVTAHNGMRTVTWQQQLDGIPVFEGLLIGHITRNGELVNLSSHFVPTQIRPLGFAAANRDTSSLTNAALADQARRKQRAINGECLP